MAIHTQHDHELSEEERKRARLTLDIDPQLHLRIKVAAAQAHCSMREYTERLLQNAVPTTLSIPDGQQRPATEDCTDDPADLLHEARSAFAESRPVFDQTAIAAFCQRWRITELALFGSVLRTDFRPDSDVDVLVTFADDARWSLIDEVQMTDELESIISRKVDLLSRQAVEASHNWIRRRAILNTARVIYAA
jgi:predicted nucleotidyltransferase